MLACAARAAAAAQDAPLADPAVAFGAQESVIAPELSPDGTHIAYISPGPGPSTLLVVYDRTTGRFTAVTRANGQPMRLRHCGWAAADRVVCEESGALRDVVVGRNHDNSTNMSNSQAGQARSPVDFATNAGDAGVLAPFRRVVALDVAGKNLVPLGRNDSSTQLYARQDDGQVLDWLDGRDGSVLMTRYYVPEMSTGRRTAQVEEGYAVEKLDTRTARSTLVERPKSDTRYLSDGAGNVRLMTHLGVAADGQLSGDDTHFYRLTEDREWRRLGGAAMRPLAIDPAVNAVYVLAKLEGRDALYRLTLDGTLHRDLVFAHPAADVTGVVTLGRNGRVIGARYVTDRPHVEYFGAAYRQLAADIARALPNQPTVDFVGASADERLLLLHAGGVDDPGRFLVFDRADNRVSSVLDSRPDLKGITLGRTRPVQYAAPDGTMLNGYLTLPPGVEKPAGLPALVVAPGGTRDAWGFDWLVQFYATRGFAVLQPQFRGPGTGDGWFVANGFRNWPQAVGDVIAAAHWLVSQGADGTKLAVAGGSYGGYAALQANVVEPELFKAVVAIAPVTDLEEFAYQKRGVDTERLRRQYIGTGAHLEAGSPARHAAQFKAPVLMFHGGLDVEIDAAESTDMNKTLRKAGRQSDAVVYADLDHDFADSTARADLLRRSNEFLRASLELK